METTHLIKSLNKVRIGSIGLLAGLLSISLAVLIPAEEPALAVSSSLGLSVNNTTGTSYTSVPFIVNTYNESLIASGKMLPSGLDSRVLNGSGTEVPRMLADNYTLFVGDAPAHVSSGFTFTTGNTPSSSMPIITGVSGNVSTADAPDLELDRHFDISISGYFNTSVNGTSQSVLYKQGAAKINVSAPSTITFHALNADDSDNWTISGAMSTGSHTVRVYADGLTAYLYVDGAGMGTQNLYITSVASLGNKGVDATTMRTQSRMGFYSDGRYWQFYFKDHNNVYFDSSTDGATWASEVAVTTDNSSGNGKFAVWFDGTYVHYARIDTTPSPDVIYYRRGDPQGDGSITWSAAEQSVGIGTNNFLSNITIAVTSSGYPVIGYDRTPGATPQVTIVQSSANDGTWTTPGGFPMDFTSPSSSVAIATDSAGGAYAIYRKQDGAGWGQGTLGRRYNGVTWSGADETVYNAYSSIGSNARSIVADDFGNYYAIYTDTANGQNLRVRSVTGSWGTPVLVCSGALWLPTTTYDPIDNSVYVFYTKGGTGIYYRHYLDGVLGSETELSNAAFDSGLSSFSQSFTDRIAVASERWTGAYYEPKVALLTFPWEWNDTVNSWWWATSNTMPYTDNISLSALGTQELLYRPNNMIYGTALPDVSAIGTHTGTIYFGSSTVAVSGAALITLPATNITTSSAVLNGQLLDMAGQASFTTYFDFGLSTSYGGTTSFVVVSTPQLLSANVSGLFPNTTYHFRAVAVSANITLYGGDLSFITQSGPGTGNFQFGGGNARVFRNYITSGDMLFTAEVVNTYPPYYPNQSPKEFFTVQLIGTDNTTILGATPQQDWGDKPIGIYLNPTQAAGITDHGAYYIRMQANFSSNVSVQYQLQDSDWKGYDLTKLDDWCIYVALGMQTYYNGAGYVTVLTDRKLAITDAVGGYFTAGIAGIGQVRPNLFTTSQQNAIFTAGVSGLPADNATGYVAFVGNTVATDAGVLGTPLGLTGRDMLAAGMAAAMLGVIMLGTSAMGGFGALGLFLIAVPILWLGTYFQVVGVQWVMILTVVFGFLAIRQFIIKTT